MDDDGGMCFLSVDQAPGAPEISRSYHDTLTHNMRQNIVKAQWRPTLVPIAALLSSLLIRHAHPPIVFGFKSGRSAADLAAADLP
jgi:hypothetical protein